ncbi:MAG: DUF1592 domain-containing protein [Bradymonadia bacterium]
MAKTPLRPLLIAIVLNTTFVGCDAGEGSLSSGGMHADPTGPGPGSDTDLPPDTPDPPDPEERPEPGDDTGTPQTCAEGICAVAADMRRLTGVQIRNSVHDLFYGQIHTEAPLPAPGVSVTGYSGEANANAVNDAATEQLLHLAEEVALQVAERTGVLLEGCDGPGRDDFDCALQFIGHYGRRAWRRPLTDDEWSVVLQVYQAGEEADLPFEERIALMTEVLLQAPQFLYQIEIGEPVDDQPQLRRLTDFELASRMAYLLWDTLPDEALLSAAEDGQLRTRTQIEAQARRMLDDARAHGAALRFFREWMQLGGSHLHDKDWALAGFDPSLADAMEAGLDQYLLHTIFDTDGTLEDLLSSTTGFIDEQLADFYDVPFSGEPVDLGPERAGLLTRPAFLAEKASPTESSPIHRGVFVIERMLCGDLGSPPDDALERFQALERGANPRAQSEILRAVPECNGCHARIDSAGLGFEAYGPLGELREVYRDGTLIDASSEIWEGSVRGSFEDLGEMQRFLADQPEVLDCLTRQWFQSMFGRHVHDFTREDRRAIAHLQGQARQSGGQIRALMLNLVTSDAFRYRHIEEN